MEDNNINNEKHESTLEDNIINIEIPANIEEEKVEDYTTVPTNNDINETNATKNDSVMVEKSIDDGTVNGKGLLPVFLIFGFFILLIIIFPYISDYLAKKTEDEKNSTNPVVSPTPTPTVEVGDNFMDLYRACGTNRIFTDITIDYNKNENQCFKIILSDKKNFIKYVAPTADTTYFSIYLGEIEIYTKGDATKISKIMVTSNTVKLEETDTNGNINTYSYDSQGNLIN